MARTQTIVQLDEELRARLDDRARADGVSRSRVIRDAVEAWLGDDHEARIARHMAEFWSRDPDEDAAEMERTMDAAAREAWKDLD